ncbi:hypothetical protein [Aquimarina sp. SS2-1]|uniref:hypothetical protein n=1 Tax=Aquimarina besae TaxID=3342247 RepID=UPI0036720F60
MKNLLLLLSILTYTNYSSGQDITGKWVMVVDDHTYSSPNSLIRELTENKEKIYSLDSLCFINQIKIDTTDKLIKYYKKKQIVNEINYELQDSLTLIEYSKSRRTKKINKFIYTKLIPTTIKYPVDSIYKKQYEHFYPISMIRQEARLKLQGDMCSDKMKKIYERMEKLGWCYYYRLEKIDNTYFIAFYWRKNKRKWIVPIAEINRDHLLVYGIPGKEGFMKINEIKEIKESYNFIKN